MNIVSVTSQVYSKADHSSIDCVVTFDNATTVPYTASASDTASYGITLWNGLIAGTYGAIGAYSAPTPVTQPPSASLQIATVTSALITKGVLLSTDIPASTLTAINATLTSANLTPIATLV